MKIDILFKNAHIFNVFIKKWLLQDVAVLGERVLFTGDASQLSFEPVKVVECRGNPLIPGMIDIHLHIESTLCTPVTFARYILGRGVTTIVSEPHEIANVFGVKGIEEMIRVSEGAPVDIFYGVPSSVPSTSAQLETTGGTVSPKDAQKLLADHKEVICLGEIMNYTSLISMEQERTVDMINSVRTEFPLSAVEGHCPSIRDLDLAKVLFAGVDSDHCLQDPEGLRQRFENGMFVELQEKSITKDNIELINSYDYSGLYSFVTDDVPPDILVKDGHLDFIARKALQTGLSLEQVITATSWAPACRMGFRDRGCISPGKLADLLLLKDHSNDFQIEKIYRKGQDVSAEKNFDEEVPVWSSDFRNSLNLSEIDIQQQMFQIISPKNTSTVKLLSIVKNGKNTYTGEGSVDLPVRNGLVVWEKTKGNLVLVVDRYSGDGGYTQAYLDGCYFTDGAMATSYAHDHHNLLAAGDNKSDMEIAMKWVVNHQGGICIVSKGSILASIELPIGGILSEEPMISLSMKIGEIGEAMRQLGFHHRNPLMSFSTLTLPVSPELKVTDRGIIRTADGEILNLLL